MTQKAKGSTLPTYSFVFISETASLGVQVSSAGSFTAKDTWALVPGGVAPANLSPTIATSPNAATFRGQDATGGFAATGGDIILSPGVGSVSNPSGNVVIQDTGGNAGWNTAHLKIGIYHIWVDATGDLRIKNSAPVSDTDGTVVGTQS
jgi:hypothetical protein